MSLQLVCALVLGFPAQPTPEDTPAAKRAAYKRAADTEFSYGNIKKALEFAQKAVAISKETPGEWTPEYSDDLYQLARVQLELNDLRAAIATTEQVIAIRHKVEPNKPWRIAQATSTLRYLKRVEQMAPEDFRLLRSAALAFREASHKDQIGQTQAAADLAAKAINDRRKAVGYVDKPLAEEILLQSVRQSKLGRDTEGERLFKEGLSAMEELFGKISRDRSAAIQSRATTLRKLNLLEAVKLQREAAEGYRTVLGDDHEASRKSWQIMSSMYREQAEKLIGEKKINEASQVFLLEGEAHISAGASPWKSREAVALADQWKRIDRLSVEDMAKVNSAIELIEMVSKLGPKDGAAEALATIDRSLGRGSSMSLKAASKLTYSQTGTEEVVDRAFADLIARFEAERGKDYPLLKEAVEQWADLMEARAEKLEKTGKFTEAVAIYERAVKLLTDCLGRDYHLTRSASCQLDLERVLARSTEADRQAMSKSHDLLGQCGKSTTAGRFAEAMKLAEEAMAIRRRVLGEPCREVAFCHYAIGSIMEKTNRFADAEKHYREALSQYSQVQPFQYEPIFPESPDFAIGGFSGGGLCQGRLPIFSRIPCFSFLPKNGPLQFSRRWRCVICWIARLCIGSSRRMPKLRGKRSFLFRL